MDFSQLPLKDVEMPEAIGWWPLAPGWWVLLALIAISLIAFLILILRKRKNPKQVALKELYNIKRRFDKHQDQKRLLVECNILIKRLALTLYPRSQVAALSGQQWLGFLQESSVKFDAGLLKILVHGPYQASVELNGEELIQNCHQWIKQVRGAGNV